MNLIRSAFWIILFLGSTFSFLVVFEHGFSNFGVNAQKEWKMLQLVAGLGDKAAKGGVTAPK